MLRRQSQFIVVATAALVGCNSSGVVINDKVPKETVELSKELGGLLAKVRPAAESGELPLLFAVGGELPKDQKAFAKFNFGLGQLPTSGGDELSVVVDISVPNLSDPWQATWKFKRDNGELKIAAAPLPTSPTPARRNSNEG